MALLHLNSSSVANYLSLETICCLYITLNISLTKLKCFYMHTNYRWISMLCTAYVYVFPERTDGANVNYKLLDTMMYQITSLKPRIIPKQFLNDGLRLSFVLPGCLAPPFLLSLSLFIFHHTLSFCIMLWLIRLKVFFKYFEHQNRRI